MTFKRIYKALIISVVFLAVVVTYLLSSKKAQLNPVTGKMQHITVTPDQEILLGIESAPELAIQFGGIYQNGDVDKKVKTVGKKLVSSSDIARSPYQFDFHVLADSHTIDTFALPGGQIFLTLGLYKKLKTNDELATILSHQIAHVIGRHASEKLFKNSVLNGIVNPDTVLISELPPRLISKYLSDFIKLAYDNSEENEADRLGFQYAVRAGFNRNSFTEVLTSGSDSNLEEKIFFDKHPNFLTRKNKLDIVLENDKN